MSPRKKGSRRAAALARMDKAYVWHPFTQMREWNEKDILVIESGDGPYLVDVQGRRYLDGVSSLWCNLHGHRVGEIDRAIKAQVGRIAHSTFLGLSNAPAIALSKELVRLSPAGLQKVFYSDSGSEAVEIALKMAFQYWQHKGFRGKSSFLKLTDAYHGDTLGSVSVGGIDLFHRIFRKLLFKSLKVKGPDAYHEKFKGSEGEYAERCAARVEKVLRKSSSRIAAIVMEPLVQGAAGMITHPKGFLGKVSLLAKRYGVLLILDEVATGFGRTGRMFACEHENVSPDILCVAKGITGGYLPLAATLVTDKVYDAFLGRYEEFKTFFHGHTYTANPLACAAALANLKIFREKDVLGKVRRESRWLAEDLEMFRTHPCVGDIRCVGLMAGVELVMDKKSGRPFPPRCQVGQKVAQLARQDGVILRPLGGVMVLMPPYCLTRKEVRKLCCVMLRAVDRATRAALQEIPA